MPTVYTVSCGATGRDYATMALAEADIGNIATSTDLLGNDEAVVVEMYADADFDERVTISGVTGSDPTRNVTYKAAAGQQFTTAGGAPLGTGVNIAPSSGSGHTLTVLDEHTHFEGLQISTYGGGSDSDESVRLGNGSSTAAGTTFRRCWGYGDFSLDDNDVWYMGNWDAGTPTYPIRWENCWGTNANRAAIHFQNYTSGTNAHYGEIVNCTISTNNRFGVGYRTAGGGTTLTILMLNTVIGKTSNAGGPGTGGDFTHTSSHDGTLITTGSANNFDEDGQVPAGTTIVFTDDDDPGAGDWAIFVDCTSPSTTDLSLVDDADNDVIGGGVGPGSNGEVPTEDIFGTARSGSTTDPGAFAIPSAPPGGGARRVFVVSSVSWACAALGLRALEAVPWQGLEV